MDYAHEFDVSLLVLTLELLGSDEIQALSGLRSVQLRAGERSFQHVNAILLVVERDRHSSPVDTRVSRLQPLHSENNIVAVQRGDDQVEMIGVGADAEADRREHTGRGRGGAIGEAHLI